MGVQPPVTTEGEVPLTSIFEERAENLSALELASWTSLTRRDLALIEKLKGPGAKLLSGPRGSGKSTLLRSAYFGLLHDRSALPAYVNYARSLALEPLFHRQANALVLFRQWLLAKVVIGVREALGSLGIGAPETLEAMAAYATDLVRSLEAGANPTLREPLASPSDLVSSLESWSDQLGFKRVVLLLDDAAHAFSPEQQREFFELFRELRTRRISAKAAVYPGITSYSPHFHVGHEAEVLEAWYRPDAEDYVASMRDVVERRVPENLRAQLADRQELVDLLALAAFGLPRGFLNMLSQLFGVDEDGNQKPSRQRAERAVADHAESVRGIFRALSVKLPRFKHFVQVGRQAEQRMVRLLRTFNKLRTSPAKKATVVAIAEPLPPEMDRILNMLEYAGLVRRIGPVSRGVKGRFQRYALHNALILTENALSLGRSYPVASAVRALASRDAHAFARTKPIQLLGSDFAARCRLDLPPCSVCGAERVSEEQRFCMKCGSELTDVSVYEELLHASIDALPLTRKKLQGILTHTALRTVQDVLLDDEKQTLRRVPYIGPVWAARIRNYAEEFVSV